MKGFNKINRGLLLTIVILIGVGAHLMASASRQSEVRPEIERVCRAYVEAETQAYLLPQQYRTVSPNIPTAALNDYLDEAANTVSSFYSEDSYAKKQKIEEITQVLKNQAQGRSVILQYERTIRRFKGFYFEGNTVEVSLDMRIDCQESSNGSMRFESSDTITLQKVGGDWKIAASGLTQPGFGALETW